jgi:hypothetical protein
MSGYFAEQYWKSICAVENGAMNQQEIDSLVQLAEIVELQTHAEKQQFLAKALDEITAFNFYKDRRNFLTAVEEKSFELLRNRFALNNTFVRYSVNEVI